MKIPRRSRPPTALEKLELELAEEQDRTRRYELMLEDIFYSGGWTQAELARIRYRGVL